MPLIEDWQADIHFSVNGKTYGNAEGPSWATYDGGDLTASAQKTRSGGMGRSRSAGGPAERSDITLTIQFDDVFAAYHNELESLVGTGGCSVSLQYLNPDRSAVPGAHFTRTGTLQAANLPKSDANSPNIGFYTVVISADEAAA